MKFGRETDRELVINTARGVGWSPFESLDTHEESFNDAAAVLGLNAYVSVEKVWIAREVFDTWRNANAQNVKIYCRYKFYDKGWQKFKRHFIAFFYAAQTILSVFCKDKIFNASNALTIPLGELNSSTVPNLLV